MYTNQLTGLHSCGALLLIKHAIRPTSGVQYELLNGNITPILDSDRESRRDSWFENRLVMVSYGKDMWRVMVMTLWRVMVRTCGEFICLGLAVS